MKKCRDASRRLFEIRFFGERHREGQFRNFHSASFMTHRKLFSVLSAVLVLGAVSTTPATAQSRIVGSWLTEDGETISVEPCSGAFCATVASGRYKGAAVARVSGSGPELKGTVYDPRNGKSYPGSLVLEGDNIALRGCIMEVFCKTVQYWQPAR